MNKRRFLIISFLLLTVLSSSGCEIISSFSNPFMGSWKSGLFNFTFNSNKTFKLEIGSSLSFKTDGTYIYDKERLQLYFSDHSQTIFKYKFNEDKTELLLSPIIKLKWFKTTLKFEKN
jgi:hypothetical protein